MSAVHKSEVADAVDSIAYWRAVVQGSGLLGYNNRDLIMLDKENADKLIKVMSGVSKILQRLLVDGFVQPDRVVDLDDEPTEGE